MTIAAGDHRTPEGRAARCGYVEYGRGDRISPDTPSPSLLIPVTNVPSYIHRASEIA